MATSMFRFPRNESSQSLDVFGCSTAPLDACLITQGICFLYIQKKFLLVQLGPHGPFLCTSMKSFPSSPELPGSKLRQKFHLLFFPASPSSSSPGFPGWRLKKKIEFFLHPTISRLAQPRIWMAPCHLGGLPSIVPVYPCAELDRALRNLSHRDMGWARRNFSLETTLLLVQPGMEVVSVLVSVLLQVLRDFLCLVLSNFMKMKLSPDLGLWMSWVFYPRIPLHPRVRDWKNIPGLGDGAHGSLFAIQGCSLTGTTWESTWERLFSPSKLREQVFV